MTTTEHVHSNSQYAMGMHHCFGCRLEHAKYQADYRARRKVWDIEYQGQVVGQMVVQEVRE